MLELILTRHGERRLVQRAQALRFLVLDELHTYRGRQGTDVALLMRRAREAFEAPGCQFVGTSATLGGGDTQAERQVRIAELPVLPPATYVAQAPWAPGTILESWLLPRVLELVYTAWDLASFARDCGHDGPPFRWDEERRFHLRCELDAAFFHLYGISRDDADYIMDTFPIVRRHDESRHGDDRTKRLILQIYDALADSIATGVPYRTLLDPPPADPRCCHPSRSHDPSPQVEGSG